MTPWITSSRECDGAARLLPVLGLDSLIARLAYEPTDPAVLAAALAHRSWCSENPGHESNERLEFLGDAVLGLAVTTQIYASYPDLDEGQLTDIRKAVVNAMTLAEVAQDLELGPCLLLGKGEEQSGGREKPSILADALEAVIGAVYLDGGLDSASALVQKLLGERVHHAQQAGGGGHDHKSRLQELAAQLSVGVPTYEAQGSGPDHARTFLVTVRLGDTVLGEGTGRSKKQAEQLAARAALAALTDEMNEGPSA